ncbi:MAG TPA: sensor histidine kinase, partial [Actinomycetota bacterium]|nr:sensor histidine kinase [Actinomycetota bacterium]
MPGTLALVTIVPWLVRDKPLGRWAGLAVAAGVGMTASLVLVRVTDPYPWPLGEPSVPFPLRSQAWVDVIESAFRWQMGALTALGLLAALGVAIRWRRSPEQRRGLGWLAIGATLLTLAFLPLALTDEAAEVLPVWFTPGLHLASQLFFPGAVLVAVLRQRLWGLDLVVSRALVWALLTAGVVATYLAVVAGLGPVLTSEDVPEVLAAAIVAAGFQPARVWVQRRVDHLVRGTGATPLRIVREVGTQLGTSGPTDLIASIAARMAESLRLGSVTIETDAAVDAEPDAPVAQVGEPSGPATVLPLVVRQVAVGRLSVTARPGERLDARTLGSLDDLAPVVAATVHLSITTAALTRSRRRLSDARDEERRALRRE